MNIVSIMLHEEQNNS